MRHVCNFMPNKKSNMQNYRILLPFLTTRDFDSPFRFSSQIKLSRSEPSSTLQKENTIDAYWIENQAQNEGRGWAISIK